MMGPKYIFKNIEKKWQKIWAKNRHKVWHALDEDKKPKKYVLDMFPYPSGEGLHVGHVEGYTASDIVARYLRMKGFNVLHPMGWDAFGLPAENYAIKTKTHPSLIVERNIKRFKKQLNSLGFSYDWQREINTTDPDYYKWTQWIFLKLFENGLAYEKEMSVNWCLGCKTVLANEEVVEGKCERCGSFVERKNLKQWVLKITDYADRLLGDLKDLDWPEKVKEMQRNWIGRSEGAIIKFEIRNSKFETNPKSQIQNSKQFIEVFTTRADTLPGATYLVLAPEHSIIKNLEFACPPKPCPSGRRAQRRRGIWNLEEVKRYIERARRKSERERVAETKDKTGVELKGIKAINPLTKKLIPIWISDYVLAHYGTGAIMAVPAHDERDYLFAQKFDLPIARVVRGQNDKLPYLGNGTMINSGKFNGMDSLKAGEAIIKEVNGEKKINYKLRDWIFSRQRYWGEPIPLVFCPACKKRAQNYADYTQTNAEINRRMSAFSPRQSASSPHESAFTKGELLNPGWIAVPEEDLPVKLPAIKNYQPTGKTESPLAGIKKWVNVKCPRCGGPARRETNTMPQWAGSNWYYIAYIVRENSKLQSASWRTNSKSMNYWLPVDLYIGGVEHAVLHLLYARFWHKFLYDIGVAPVKEPFKKLINQGLILGPDGQKMSKSRGNVINPDEMVEKFGADSLRLYEMFMGPLEDSKPWSPYGVVGLYRFLNRIWNLISSTNNESITNKRIVRHIHREIRKFEKNSLFVDRLLHQTTKKVTEDIEMFRFNTAISALMIAVNELEKRPSLEIGNLEKLIKLLFPFAPHLAQELWAVSGHKNLLDYESWPAWDEKLIKEEKFELVIQVNGKFRATAPANRGISQAEAEKSALLQPPIKKWISDKKQIKKVIFVPDKLINFIIATSH